LEADMSAYPAVSLFRWNLVAAALTLILPVSGLALDSAPPEALSVKVFPDRYVAAGKPFSDLAGLEAWAKQSRIRVLWFESCGPASAKRLMAAVERFDPVYVEGIQIQTFAPAEPGCLGAAEQASWATDSVSRAPAEEVYYATDQSGRSMMP
jgi:hypothetical protein